MAYEFLFANNATTTLAQAISATATVITVASGDGDLFPSPASGQAFAITLVDAATGLTNEICYCTSRSGDELTVVRGQEGKDAIAWSAGDTCANYITADVIENWLQESDLDGYLTVTAGDARYLMLSSTALQTVTGPVTLSGTTLVPAVSDWTAYQAVGAKDADARYVQNIPNSSKLGVNAATVDSSTGAPSLRDSEGTWHPLATVEALNSAEEAINESIATKVTSENGSVENLGYDSALGYFFIRRASGVSPMVASIPTTGSVTAISLLAYDPVNDYLYTREAETGTVHTIASTQSLPASGSTGSSGYYIRVGNTLIQQFETTGITSTAQWITFPVEFSGTPAPPVGNVYGSGDQDTQVYGATSSGCYVKCPSGSQTQGQPVSIIVIGPVS